MLKKIVNFNLMKLQDSDLDEFIVTTVLADLFDSTGSDDLDVVSQKIADGLSANRMIDIEKSDDDEHIAA